MRRIAGPILVAVLLQCGALFGQDIGWPPAQVAKTGAKPYPIGTTYPDDTAMQEGVTWPNPRFTSNVDQNGDGDCSDAGEACNGTVTDNLTGLVWLRNADCGVFYQGDPNAGNQRGGYSALISADNLAQGYCGLIDGSSEGDWRLPNIGELGSLVHFGEYLPAVPDTIGTGKNTEGNPFFSIQADPYWSSTPDMNFWIYDPPYYWGIDFEYGDRVSHWGLEQCHVWPVRTGAPVFADGFGPASTQQWTSEGP